MEITQKLAAAALATLVTVTASAADLGTFNPICGGPGVITNQTLNANIGDTFTVIPSVAGPGICLISATVPGIVNPSAGAINRGVPQVFTVVAAGTTTLTTEQNGTGISFTINALTATVQSVPTLTHAGTALMALLVAGAALLTRRRKG